MTSARTWKVVLGYSLLLICVCAGCALVFFDVDNITCRMRNPIIDTESAQIRFTESQRVFISALQEDEIIRQDRSEEPIVVIVGKLYCGCKRGWVHYSYRSQESVTKVLERFTNNTHVPGWSVRYSYDNYVEFRNAANTAMATITIQNEEWQLPTVYEVTISFAEPSFAKCSEMG